MLNWLNSWGCRQFAKACHVLAAEGIRRWYERNQSRIPAVGAILTDLTDQALQETAVAYGELKDCYASDKKRKSGDQHRVTCGPTGAAKILYVLRPDALLPWDDSIRGAFGYDGEQHSYLEYLLRVRGVLRELIDEAERKGLQPHCIPKHVGRPESSLPKLIDEYHWITITKGKS